MAAAVTAFDAFHSLDDRSGAYGQGTGGGGGHKNQALTLADFYDYYLIQKIRLYMPWFIIGFGLTGNLLILAIFLKKSRRCTSNGICFSALAIADSLALIFMLMRALLKLHIVSNMAVTCKLIKFIYHVSLQLSSWCLVLLTIDRLIAVLFVFKYISWCKRFFVLRALALIFVLVVLLNIHLVIFRDARPQTNVERYVYNYNYHNYIRHRPSHSQMNTLIQINERPKYTCYVDPIKYSFYFVHIYNAWDIYHCVIYGAAPFLIILVCNVTIIYKLSTAHKNKAISKTPMTTTDNDEGDKEEQQVHQGAVNRRQQPRKTRDPTIKSIQITIMLLAIAFLFLILTSPISIYMAVFYQRLPHWRDSRRELIKVILRYIGYVNNAANFYIYMIFSSEFRREFIGLFKQLFKCRCFRRCARLFGKSSSCCSKSTDSTDSRLVSAGPTTSSRLASSDYDTSYNSRRLLSLSKTMTDTDETTTNETLTRTLLSSSKRTPPQLQPKNDVSNIYTDYRVLAKGRARTTKSHQPPKSKRNESKLLNESLTPFIQPPRNLT